MLNKYMLNVLYVNYTASYKLNYYHYHQMHFVDRSVEFTRLFSFAVCFLGSQFSGWHTGVCKIVKFKG